MAQMHETLERHEHMAHGADGSHNKRAALVIGIIAATLAIAEMEERSAQNGYLSHHITASDEFAFYQARQTRALVLTQSAALLKGLPSTPETTKAANDAEASAKRLIEDSDRGNGAQQILARAEGERHERDHELHKYEWFEIVTSALQIAIVLASVSVVTQLGVVLLLGGVIGVAAATLGILVVTHVV